MYFFADNHQIFNKMNIRLVLFLLIIICNFLNTNKAYAQEVKAFYIGHSLSDQIPDMVQSLADDHENTEFDWVYQSIPGAPLRWQWQRKDLNDYGINPPYYYGFYHPTGGLPSGDVDVLVLTESVPRHWTEWGIYETYQYADSFYLYAKEFNPDIKVYLYEDWHCLNSGTPTGCPYDINSNPWRQRITDDLPMWESVVDSLNKRHTPEEKVCLIPAAQGLAKLYDEIEAGNVPGISHIGDLFSDDIHLTDIGKYFVACIHFATIFERSPEGLTNQSKVWWGGDFNAPTEEQAAVFQKIAWQTVIDYPKTCVQNVSGTQHNLTNNYKISISPNPTSDMLNIDLGSDDQNYEIINALGKHIYRGNVRQLDITSFESGIYWIKSANSVIKFIKN